MSKKVDARVLTFDKWNIPKEGSYTSMLKKDSYLATCYFDIIKIKKVGNESVDVSFSDIKNPNSSLMSQYYSAIQDNSFSINIVHRTQQHYFLLTDVTGAEKFWDKAENTNRPLVVTMLKLCGTSYDESISVFKERVEKIFSDKDYVWYYTLDFSEIVIFSLVDSLQKYLTSIWELNYETFDKNNQRVIQDTMTVLGANAVTLSDSSEKETLKEEVNILTRISINDIDKYYSEFHDKALKILGVEENDVDKSFGRYDLVLTAKGKPLYTAMELYNLFDQQSSNSSESIAFFDAFEICITVPLKDSCKMKKQTEVEETKKTLKNDNNREFYNKAKVYLKTLCEKYYDSIDLAFESNPTIDKGYFLPAFEISNSILSVLKNGYVEDFIISIYQSFCAMLSYVTDTLKESRDLIYGNKILEHLYKLQREYYNNLCTLINCTMRTEPQFIHVQAFHAMIYGVPPKLLAFYTSQADLIREILSSEEKQDFSFMFVPDFQPDVHVVSMMRGYNEKDQLLTVYINEQTLLNPHNVISTMSHEVAHYVGETSRCREARAKYILEAILGFFLENFFIHIGLKFACSDPLYNYIKKISEDIASLINDNISEFKHYQIEYMSSLRNFILDTNKLYEILKRDEYVEKLNIHFYDFINTSKEEFSECLSQKLDPQIGFSASNLFDNKEYYRIASELMVKEFLSFYKHNVAKDKKRIIDRIISVFKETYADMEMINLLQMPKDEYNSIFEEKLILDDISLDLRLLIINHCCYNDNGRFEDGYNCIIDSAIAYINLCASKTHIILESLEKKKKLEEFRKTYKCLKIKADVSKPIKRIFSEIDRYKDNLIEMSTKCEI